MATLERAIAIAATAYEGATDKAGEPYILHPLRVMMTMDARDDRIVAVLHDVVEDSTDWTFERLAAEGFSANVIAALEAVTKRADEQDAEGDDAQTKLRRYLGFVARAAGNEIGRKVKIADLEDNLRATLRPTPRDIARAAKYRAALELLRAS